MAIQGGERHLETRCGICDDTGGINKYLAVTPGTVQGHITIAGANEPRISGVTIEDTDAVNIPCKYACRGSVYWQASAAIDRLTSTLPTQIIGAASGQCAKLPTTNGTWYVVGEMDPDSDSAAAGNDIVLVRLYDNPVTVTISL